MKLLRQIWIPDTHVPFHDKRALGLLHKVAASFKPHETVILGDFGDFYSVSSHSKDPRKERSLLREVDAVLAELAKIEQWSSTRRVYVCGNHEQRLERYLADKAPELYESLLLPDVLGLGSRWEWVPYRQHTKIGKVYATHDTGTAGAVAHTKAHADFQDNIVIGHTHRLAYSVVGNAKGKPHVAAMFGWLGDRTQADYMHTIKARRDWALGFGLGYRTPDGTTYLTPVPIVNYTCLVEGKLFKN